ncbi:MAG: peptidase domain-containing ABC transporter, partial [Gammaproteobacteria bacterium]|nr:peptidase domain-containing ABC transporter [Gammaproteobacteria bacterium]
MTAQESSISWLAASGGRRLPLIRQATATECGLACVAMIANYFGIPTDLTGLRRAGDVSLKGATLISISACCRNLGLATRSVRCDLGELRKLRKPCILHWRFNHFVVLKTVRKDAIVIHDPARGEIIEKLVTASSAFTGIALEVMAAPRYRQAKSFRALKLADLVPHDASLNRKFAAGLVLALICEALLLATPFYLQLVIDQVLAKGDRYLLNTLAVAFCILLVIHVMANVMRQLTFHYLGHVSVFDITSRILHRLLMLPTRYFRSRELGDIQHRILSLGRVQSFVVQSVPALVLDTVFLILISVLMMLYDVRLTFLMIAALSLWCVWRVFIVPVSLRLSSDIAQAESSVQTHFLESLRAVQSIKLANGESQRESEWKNLYADATNSRIRASNLQVADGAVRQIIFQGARVATIYLLAVRGLDGQISIGMISAYVAYLGMFSTRSAGIVDRMLEYKLLDVPLNRLADIVFSEEEPMTSTSSRLSIGSIELRDVGFSYSKHEPAILRGCSAYFRERELTAIAGPSGVGKSTLLQLIAGNEMPSHGQLIIGGTPACHWQPQNLRTQMAVVMQGDTLLKGSVAENIALFDDAMDRSRVRNAARAACIHADIESWPMAYETRIGDLGSALSRGQVQRILLARAYYRRPALLLLDEATSGLDYQLEKALITSLAEIDATIIVVTHSDLMLQAADKVLWLHDGR